MEANNLKAAWQLEIGLTLKLFSTILELLFLMILFVFFKLQHSLIDLVPFAIRNSILNELFHDRNNSSHGEKEP